LFSLQGGDAHSLATALYDTKTHSGFGQTLLHSYYGTDIDRANIFLFDVKRLLNLQLDPSVTPTSFIANFKECLLCLQKHNAKLVEDMDTLHTLLLIYNAKLAEDTDTLHTLLLVAIQDD
jgi:hypothetical protein